MVDEIAGSQRIRTQVLDEGLCTFCGACTGLCPYLKPFRGRVAAVDNCQLAPADARCFQFCPRTGADMDRLSVAALGVPYQSSPLGEVQSVFIARSTAARVRDGAQYGGTVSTLLSVAIEAGVVDTAVLARSVDGMPRGVAVSTTEEVLQCRGSNYLAAPTLEAFHRLPQDGKRIGVVGTPCQMLALAKMRIAPLAPSSNIGQLALTVGLFCTWALSHRFVGELARIAPSTRILKTDVPPPPASVFEVVTPEGRISLPLDEVRRFIPPACSICHDMTAELADLSVGSAEGIAGWNTVLVRTRRGEELVQLAVSRGRLEQKELPQASHEHLSWAASNKKQRALRRLDEEARSGAAPYLQLSPAVKQGILQG